MNAIPTGRLASRPKGIDHQKCVRVDDLVLRLPKFDVAEPTSIEEAIALLVEYENDARLMAGGTDLMPNMKHEIVTPKLVVASGASKG